MKAQARLEEYLGGFRRRLRTLILARGAAALCAAALAATLLAVYIGTRQAFPAELMTGARLLLALTLGAIAALLLIRPLRALRRTRGVADIERRAPDFDGRIETYAELAGGKRKDAAPPSPFLGLLAEDAWRLARRTPAALRVPGREIMAPGALAGAALAALAWFAAFGPDNWRYGVRHVWAGWAMADTLPPQRIVVNPGDGAVRRGGDLVIDARAEGFDPVAAEVFARFESSEDWESAPMLADGGEFGFTFFAVREPVRYYVAAAGVRSEEFQVEAVDLPRVRNVRLTYRYPRWTGLESETEDPGDDISAVAGTQVEVAVTTDQPLGEAELIVNGETLAMSADGAVATGVLEVSESGEYYVSTYFADDPVRLTDDYFIDALPDNKPEVSVARPGRDYRANNIEEVSVRVEARDDFGLDRLQLHYSINGGEWNIVELDVDGAFAESGEVLYLEEMDKPASVSAPGGPHDLLEGNRPAADRLGGVREAPLAGAAEAGADATSGLEPGDLISYFAEAHDRGAAERTDLFFVEVQPFERSYTQSMQGGGGGGGGGGGEQNEISRRQKEILLATWNLIREQEQVAGFLDEQRLGDNAAMLAELQRTLADQARTLANRTRARQLTRVDEQIQTFVNSLESAAEAMAPAAERLADLRFDEAVPSEQEALQHLLKAESVFTDIQVSFNRGGGGGAGGFAGRDLAELFELEMDLEKNQYETESAVSFDTPEAEFDEAIARLRELARRQENLARQAGRQQQMTEQERWQQEQLRRETEELRRQLEELRQAAAGQQAQQQGGQQGGQPRSGQGGRRSGQPGQQSGQPGQLANAAGEAIRQLDNALRAMDRAQSRGGMTPGQAQRAIEQARRQLDRALEQLTDQRQAVAEAAFSELVAELQALRRELAAFRNGAQPGQPGQPGQAGQPGENGQAGGARPGQQAGGALGGNRFGPGGGGVFDTDRRGLGFWDPTEPLALDPQMRERLEDELRAAGSDLLALGTRLRAEDALTAEGLDAIRRLGDALRRGLAAGANEAIVEQEYLAMLNLMEQLELQLAAADSAEGETAVRTEAPAGVAAEYEEAVAEYFRRLSRSEEP